MAALLYQILFRQYASKLIVLILNLPLHFPHIAKIEVLQIFAQIPSSPTFRNVSAKKQTVFVKNVIP
jgi:hypothetical protein